MSYYRGDYYRGDYYRGDPGLLDFLGGAVKSVLKIGAGEILGGPFGAVGAITSLIAPKLGQKMSDIAAAGGNALIPGAGTIQQRVLAPTRTGSTIAPMEQGLHMLPPGAMIPVSAGGGHMSHARARALAFFQATGQPPRGYHLSARYGIRKNATMNPYNPRALHRAERRVGRFVRMATHMIRWVHPHKAGHAAPKIGKKRRR
jgi:hypothetical protein